VSAIVLSTGATPSIAATKIGVASAVENDVTGSIGGAAARLSAGSQLVQQMIVKTGVESVAQLLFLDQTSMTVGPKAQVTLDRFVFDPNKNVGSLVMSATKGAFRFISGTQEPHNYTINTPVATIGSRGTIASCALIGAPVALFCVLEEGSADIGGTLVHAGQAIVVYQDGHHDGPFTPDGHFFNVTGRIPIPLFGTDLGPVIERIIAGDDIVDIVNELQSQQTEGPCEGEGCGGDF